MSVMNPDLQLDDIDIIANRNSFRKLLEFAAGKRQDPFRMVLNMVNKTMFISRSEKNARMMIHGAPNSGYGHNLEKEFTVPEHGLDRSSSHHRVIRYHLGHLNCVVRFEVDAYYEAVDSQPSLTSSETALDQIASSISQLTVNDAKPARGATTVIRKGTVIPSSKLAEIKARKLEKIGETVPQLWFGRTPYLLTGQHVGGVVHSVRETDVGLKFPDWETANQDKLRKLVSLLADLKQLIGGMEKGAAVLVCEDKGAPLQIYRSKSEAGVLPEAIISRHWADNGRGMGGAES